jgi:four helix bundle protein
MNAKEHFKFEELRVYQEALLFSGNIYNETKQFPKEEVFGLTNQIRRASVSIAINIAEGSSRTKKDFRHFLDMSKGSCFECVGILAIAYKQKYISEYKYSQLYSQCLSLTKMINALKTSLR